ncbi:ABC transporter permease subunit [Cohnella yongneupensis]|uniref:ABC transporter permease subunit n=1 Tax=Cohnella yongneupensis TaxID=425006 RepID=A0ABW0QV69_9BACL
MNMWLLLFRKEMIEGARNYKWLWIPLVFAIFGISNPVTSHFLPEILKSSGVTEEAAKLIPEPTSAEVIVKSLSQYGSMGLLVLALAFMGIVAAERQSGSMIMVLVKPVSHVSYVTSKWAAMNVITLAAVAAGQLGTWYYTRLLFEDIALRAVLISGVVYALWLVFVNTITLLLSCVMKSLAGIAFVAVAAAACLTLLTQLLKGAMRWSPSRLTAEAGRIVQEGQASGSLWLILSVTVLLIALMLALAVTASRRLIR